MNNAADHCALTTIISPHIAWTLVQSSIKAADTIVAYTKYTTSAIKVQ